MLFGVTSLQGSVESSLRRGTLLALEEGNKHDSFAVCVKRSEVIGHIPRALTFTKDFTDNTEFNKHRSQLVAALE